MVPPSAFTPGLPEVRSVGPQLQAFRTLYDVLHVHCWFYFLKMPSSPAALTRVFCGNYGKAQYSSAMPPASSCSSLCMGTRNAHTTERKPGGSQVPSTRTRACRRSPRKGKYSHLTTKTEILLPPPASAYHLLLPFCLLLLLQIQLLADLFQLITLLLFSFQMLGNLLQRGKIFKRKTKTYSILSTVSGFDTMLWSLCFLSSVSRTLAIRSSSLCCCMLANSIIFLFSSSISSCFLLLQIACSFLNSSIYAWVALILSNFSCFSLWKADEMFK